MPDQAMAIVSPPLIDINSLVRRDQFVDPRPMLDSASPSFYEPEVFEREAFFAQFNKHNFENQLQQLEEHGELERYQAEKYENPLQLAWLQKIQEITDKFGLLYKNYYGMLGITIKPLLSERETKNQANESDNEASPSSAQKTIESDAQWNDNISLSAEQVVKNNINLDQGICLICSALVIVAEIEHVYAAENFFPDQEWKEQIYSKWLELVKKIESFEDEINVIPVEKPEFLQFLESNIFDRSLLFGITIATGSWIFCLGTGFFIVSRAIELLVTLILSTLNSLIKFGISLFEEYRFTPRAQKEENAAASVNQQIFKPLNIYLNEIVKMLDTRGTAAPTVAEQLFFKSTNANTQALKHQAEAVKQLDSSIKQNIHATGDEIAKGVESFIDRKLAEQQQVHQNQMKLLFEQFLGSKPGVLAQTSVSPEANQPQNISQPNNQRSLSADAFEADFQKTMSAPGAMDNASINNKDRADAHNSDNRIDSVGRYSSDIDIDKEAEEITNSLTEKFSPEQITKIFESMQRKLSVVSSLSVSPR